MKKALMILASVALGASMAAASTNVESKNIVGMVKRAATQSAFITVGVNFESIITTNINVQELISSGLYGAVVDGNADLDNSDQLMVWDGGSFTTYSYDGVAKAWSDGLDLVSFELVKGDAVWFKRAAGSDQNEIYLSGQVTSLSSVPHVAINQGYTLITTAFPVSRSINDLAIPAYGAVVDGNADLDNSDQLMMWDGGSFTTYSYDGVAGAWSDGLDLVTAPITVGEGVWFYHRVATPISWTETNPI